MLRFTLLPFSIVSRSETMENGKRIWLEVISAMHKPFEAIYQDGVLKLTKPLDLPENARVMVTITSVRNANFFSENTPLHSSEEIEKVLDQLATPLDVSLPETFSREDIYFDHD